MDRALDAAEISTMDSMISIPNKRRARMRPGIWSLALMAVVAGLVATVKPTSGSSGATTSPAFLTRIPPGYRDWRLVSVAHEEGELNDIRAILGNDKALNAYRKDERPFPEGSMITRIAWDYTSSEENNRTFGRQQSFVAGAPKNGVQFMIKDSKKYAATGGWGYGQFNDGKPADDSMLRTCFPCHEAVRARDYVFTRYAP
jgi:hypothetical protein